MADIIEGVGGSNPTYEEDNKVETAEIIYHDFGTPETSEGARRPQELFDKGLENIL